MLINSITDPTSTQSSTSPRQATSTTQPVAKPAPTPTAPTTQPATSPVSAYPTAPSAPAAPSAPTTPPPLTTSDPLAFSPAPTQPYTVPGGSTFIGGTQTTDANGNVTNPGILGTQFVPGTNGMLVDGGNGMFAPTPGVDVSNGVLQIADPIITQGYQAPGTVTSMGKIVGMTYDANGNPQPLYDSGVTDPNVAPTQASAPTTAQLLSAIVNGTSAAPGAPQPNSTTGQGAGSNGTLVPANAPTLPPMTSGARPTPGAANDAGTPSIPSTGFGSTLGSIIGGSSAPPQGGTPGSASSYAPGVSLTPTTVDNALTNDTIAPGPMADRFKIAQDEWQNFVNATQPQYDAQIRSAEQNAFGAGRGVSGALRTSLGDLANQRSLALDTQKNAFLNNALSGSIEDAYRNIGIAQQQQGFQAGQQQTAFNQALQRLLAGSSGDPTQTALILSSIFGGQGSNLGQALGNYTAAQTANQSTQIPPWLVDMISGSGASPASTAQTDPILQQGIPGVQTTGTYYGG